LAAKYIFPALALVFLAAAAARGASGRGKPHAQTRAWLMIEAIFGAVSAWLWYSG